jgi:hypothetical protein
MNVGQAHGAIFAGLALATLSLVASAATIAASSNDARVLDAMDDASRWEAVASDGIAARVESIPGERGNALRLSFDFRDRGGYVAARRALPLEYPAHFELRFRLRGAGASNHFELKLVDASGDNVWWYRKPDTTFAPEWHTVRVRKRQIEFAWGPTTNHSLPNTEQLEFVISAGEGGGAGHIDIDELTLVALPPPPVEPPAPLATASAGNAAAALDRDAASVWRARAQGAWWQVDFGLEREFGGLTLHWAPGAHPRAYRVQLSDDNIEWRTAREVEEGNGGTDWLALPESSARYLRIAVLGAATPEIALQSVVVRELSFGATPNALFKHLAQQAPRGSFPRGFVGEQSYWTIVGTDGGIEEGLFSEDGAFEIAKGAASIEPFLTVDGRSLDWATVSIDHGLPEQYLPMPYVSWRHAGGVLRIEAFGAGTADHDFGVVRYEYANRSTAPQQVELVLAIRPFQVNPPAQFLNTPGGVAPLRAIGWNGTAVEIEGRNRIVPAIAPDEFVAAPFDAAETVPQLLAQPARREVRDAWGYATGALRYRRSVQPGEVWVVSVAIPWAGAPDVTGSRSLADVLEHERAATADYWRAALNRVRLDGPATARPALDTLRTALAHVLINRDGPRLQPGSRSYERSWIRDGALSSSALLRLGHESVAREFADWYAPHLFENGKVPCCVDRRGADPVPENDSSGEFVWLFSELQRYAPNEAWLATHWPAVERAMSYLESLRQSERVTANLAPERRAMYGLLPASISHEGYSAKPMHSYWDNYWGLLGYERAVEMARTLGHRSEARRYRRALTEYRADVLASLRYSTAQHAIDFLPGAAELGDFDATSTTIALSPGVEMEHLPRNLLTNTFERYWREFVTRRDGLRQWDAYTPYEIRTIGSFIRLGWHERTPELLAYFMHDRRPAGWNQWAEVVGRDAREPRFIGDMPHGWVAGDYIRAMLDAFAYERESDAALVIGAGLNSTWLQGAGVRIAELRTPWGPLDYSLHLDENLNLHFQSSGAVRPPGGLIVTCGTRELRLAPGTQQAVIDSDCRRVRREASR